MAIRRAKPYTISWPFTPKTAEDLDQTFDILFKQASINAAAASGPLPVPGGGTGVGSFTKGDLLYADTTTTIAGLHDVALGNVLLSGGANTAPSYGKVGLTTHVSGVLPEPNGGTNQSTYAQGDILYASAANTLAKLPKNATNFRYLSNTGVNNSPLWSTVHLANGVNGVLQPANGGTGQFDYTQGDLIYATATTTLAKLPKDTNATRYLSNTGSSNNPAWALVNVSNGITGIVPRANGGTGLNASGVLNGQLLIGRTSDNSFQLATLTAGANVSITNGAGTIMIAASTAGHTLLDGTTHTDTAAYAVTRGSLIVGNSTPLWTGLVVGAANTVLRSNGLDPNWGAVSDAYISDVTEAKITDGGILARVASPETITAVWTFTASPLLSSTAPALAFTETDAASDNRRWDISVDGATWRLRLIDDAGISIVNAITVTRVGTSPAGTTVAGTLTATTFSGSGALLTNIPETAITDGTIFARVAANEVITGAWTFGTAAVIGQPVLNTPTGSNAGFQFQLNNVSNGQIVWGADAFIDSPGTLTIRTVAGVTRATLSSAGNLVTSGDVLPAVDNAKTCGNATFRWSLVRGVTITPGDLLFENGWVITEGDKYGISTPGLAVLDANDDLIAYIAQNGNLYLGGLTLPLGLLPGGFTKTTIEERTGFPRPS